MRVRVADPVRRRELLVRSVDGNCSAAAARSMRSPRRAETFRPAAVLMRTTRR
ncbi:hypothetical protein ACWDOR_27745 [Streptosporangium canum]|uniref:hypothetical protein n=1 Tax=Streptosporangium canum TaxID=324952 RepID=UPI0036B830A2